MLSSENIVVRTSFSICQMVGCDAPAWVVAAASVDPALHLVLGSEDTYAGQGLVPQESQLVLQISSHDSEDVVEKHDEEEREEVVADVDKVQEVPEEVEQIQVVEEEEKEVRMETFSNNAPSFSFYEEDTGMPRMMDVSELEHWDGTVPVRDNLEPAVDYPATLFTGLPENSADNIGSRTRRAARTTDYHQFMTSAETPVHAVCYIHSIISVIVAESTDPCIR